MVAKEEFASCILTIAIFSIPNKYLDPGAEHSALGCPNFHQLLQARRYFVLGATHAVEDENSSSLAPFVQLCLCFQLSFLYSSIRPITSNFLALVLYS